MKSVERHDELGNELRKGGVDLMETPRVTKHTGWGWSGNARGRLRAENAKDVGKENCRDMHSSPSKTSWTTAQTNKNETKNTRSKQAAQDNTIKIGKCNLLTINNTS